MIIQKINNMFGVIATELNKFKTKLTLNNPLADASDFTISFKWFNLGEAIYTRIRGVKRKTSYSCEDVVSGQYNFFSVDASKTVAMFNVNVVNYKFTEEAPDVLEWMLGDLSMNNRESLISKCSDECEREVLNETFKSSEGVRDIFDIPELNVDTLEKIVLCDGHRFDFVLELVNKETKKTAKLFFNNQPDSELGGKPMVIFTKKYVIEKDNSLGYNGSNTKQHDKALGDFLSKSSVSKELKKQANSLRQAEIVRYQEIRQSLADTNAIQDTLGLIDEQKINQSFGDYIKRGGHKVWSGISFNGEAIAIDCNTIDEVVALWVKDGLGVVDAVSFNINLDLEYVDYNDSKEEEWMHLSIIKGKKDVGYNWSALSKAIDNQGWYCDYKGTTTYVSSRSRYSSRGDYRERTASKIATVHKHIKETFKLYNDGIRFTEKRRLEKAEALQERNEGIAQQTANFNRATRDFGMLLGQSDYSFLNAPCETDDEIHIGMDSYTTPSVEIQVARTVELQRSTLEHPESHDEWLWSNANDQEKVDNYRLNITLNIGRKSFDVLITDLSGDCGVMEGRRHTEMNDVSPEQLTGAVESLIKVRRNVRRAVANLQSVSLQELDEGFEVELLRTRKSSFHRMS